MPFTRTPRRRAAERIDIDGSRSSFGSSTGEPLHGSDLLIPTPFPTPDELAKPDEVRAALFTYIDEGASRGAFDDGNAAYADQWIQAKLAGWVTLVDGEHQRRLDSAAWILGGRTQNLTVAFTELVSLRSKLTALSNRMELYAAQLSGREPDAPTTEPTRAQVAEQLADLPRSTQLSGLALEPASTSTATSNRS